MPIDSIEMNPVNRHTSAHPFLDVSHALPNLNLIADILRGEPYEQAFYHYLETGNDELLRPFYSALCAGADFEAIGWPFPMARIVRIWDKIEASQTLPLLASPLAPQWLTGYASILNGPPLTEPNLMGRASIFTDHLSRYSQGVYKTHHRLLRPPETLLPFSYRALVRRAILTKGMQIASIGLEQQEPLLPAAAMTPYSFESATAALVQAVHQANKAGIDSTAILLGRDMRVSLERDDNLFGDSEVEDNFDGLLVVVHDNAKHYLFPDERERAIAVVGNFPAAVHYDPAPIPFAKVVKDPDNGAILYKNTRIEYTLMGSVSTTDMTKDNCVAIVES
jgi:hypothetical protein